MARRPHVPEELKHGPFTLEEARQAGLTRHHLESRAWRRVEWGCYVWAGLPDDPMLRLLAISRRLPPGAGFSGRTAAWLDGLDVEPCSPVEVTLPLHGGDSDRGGVLVRRARLDADDLVQLRGLPATTMLRTLSDLALHLVLDDAVVIIDMALQARRVSLHEVRARALDTSPQKGSARLRAAVELADPGAESPMETRLRILLVHAGLPHPHTQATLHDGRGRPLGRVDLYYPAARLAIEYDGAGHRDSLAYDLRRQNGLLAAGYTLLRFTAGDVLQRPDEVAAIVRAELAKRRAA